VLARQALYHLSHNLSSHILVFVNLPFPPSFFLTVLFIYLFAVLGFELRAYTLSHFTSPFYDGFFFFEIGSRELFFSGLTLNLVPPDLCLLSS
jgi:hypothetical protein